MAREYFNAYHSYIEAIEPLNDAERGRLFTACLTYSKTGEVQELCGNERFVFAGMKSQIDRDVEAYELKCAKNRANGSKGGQANATERYQSLPNAPDRPRTPPKEKEKEKEKDISTAVDTRAARKRLSHGTYGWVKLTDDEASKLISDLGQAEFDRCVKYVDESAQSSGNKNRWKDWNLVIRRCSREKWGERGAGLQRRNKAIDYEQHALSDDQLNHIFYDLDGGTEG